MMESLECQAKEFKRHPKRAMEPSMAHEEENSSIYTVCKGGFLQGRRILRG